MASRPTGVKTPERDIRISFAGDRRALGVPVVRSLVSAVLDAEHAGDATVSVTFVSSARMRALNRRAFGKDRTTDVIGYSLRDHKTLVGDVYVCPAAARRSARDLNISPREELARLVVHGTLHVLGYDHPEGKSRIDSSMWRLQEQYLKAFQEGGR